MKWTIVWKCNDGTRGEYDVYMKQHMIDAVADLTCSCDEVTVSKTKVDKTCIAYTKQLDIYYVLINGECEYYSHDPYAAKNFYKSVMKLKGDKK